MCVTADCDNSLNAAESRGASTLGWRTWAAAVACRSEQSDFRVSSSPVDSRSSVSAKRGVCRLDGSAVAQGATGGGGGGRGGTTGTGSSSSSCSGSSSSGSSSGGNGGGSGSSDGGSGSSDGGSRSGGGGGRVLAAPGPGQPSQLAPAAHWSRPPSTRSERCSAPRLAALSPARP